MSLLFWIQTFSYFPCTGITQVGCLLIYILLHFTSKHCHTANYTTVLRDLMKLTTIHSDQTDVPHVLHTSFSWPCSLISNHRQSKCFVDITARFVEGTRIVYKLQTLSNRYLCKYSTSVSGRCLAPQDCENLHQNKHEINYRKGRICHSKHTDTFWVLYLQTRLAVQSGDWCLYCVSLE